LKDFREKKVLEWGNLERGGSGVQKTARGCVMHQSRSRLRGRGGDDEGGLVIHGERGSVHIIKTGRWYDWIIDGQSV